MGINVFIFAREWTMAAIIILGRDGDGWGSFFFFFSVSFSFHSPPFLSACAKMTMDAMCENATWKHPSLNPPFTSPPPLVSFSLRYLHAFFQCLQFVVLHPSLSWRRQITTSGQLLLLFTQISKTAGYPSCQYVAGEYRLHKSVSQRLPDKESGNSLGRPTSTVSAPLKS